MLTQPTEPYGQVNITPQSPSLHSPAASSAELPEGPITLEQAIEIGLVNNPGVAARGFEAEAAAARQDRALSERMPEMRVEGGYNRHLDEQRILPVREPDEDAVLSRNIVASDLVFSMPLFTGGRLVNQVKAADLLHQSEKQRLARSRRTDGRVRAEVREERAELAGAQKRLRELELEIRLEIETALADLESSEKRAAALGKSIAQARESLRIEQQKYDLGKGAIVDVLDAQDALLDTETTYYKVLAELRTAMAQLKLAMGEI